MFWPCISKDVQYWARTCVPFQRSKIQRYNQAIRRRVSNSSYLAQTNPHRNCWSLTSESNMFLSSDNDWSFHSFSSGSVDSKHHSRNRHAEPNGSLDPVLWCSSHDTDRLRHTIKILQFQWEHRSVRSSAVSDCSLQHSSKRKSWATALHSKNVSKDAARSPYLDFYLTFALLSIRTMIKKELCYSPAELTICTKLRLRGEYICSSHHNALIPNDAFASQLKTTVSRLATTQPR